MRDGISRPEQDATIKALQTGAPFEEVAAKTLHGVDPKVIAANRESLIKLAARELKETLVTPEKLEAAKKLDAQLKPKAKTKDDKPPAAAPTAPAAPPPEDLGKVIE